MAHLQKSQHLKKAQKEKTLQASCAQLQVPDFPPLDNKEKGNSVPQFSFIIHNNWFSL